MQVSPLRDWGGIRRSSDKTRCIADDLGHSEYVFLTNDLRLLCPAKESWKTLVFYYHISINLFTASVTMIGNAHESTRQVTC